MLSRLLDLHLKFLLVCARGTASGMFQIWPEALRWVGVRLHRLRPSRSCQKLIAIPATTIKQSSRRKEYHVHYLGLLRVRNGLVSGHPLAMGRLNTCDDGDSNLRHLILGNIHPFLTVRKAGTLELAFLHEVKSPRRRSLTPNTPSNTGFLFRWFWHLRSRLFRGSRAWFRGRIRVGMSQIDESRV